MTKIGSPALSRAWKLDKVKLGNFGNSLQYIHGVTYGLWTIFYLDDSSTGSVGEMNFIGHTDAVCCILVSNVIHCH